MANSFDDYAKSLKRKYGTDTQDASYSEDADYSSRESGFNRYVETLRSKYSAPQEQEYVYEDTPIGNYLASYNNLIGSHSGKSTWADYANDGGALSGSIEDARARRSDLEDYLTKNRNSFSQADYIKLSRMLLETGRNIDSIQAIHDYYGQFKTNDEYDAATMDASGLWGKMHGNRNLDRDISWAQDLIDTPYDRATYELAYGNGADSHDIMRDKRQYFEDTYGIRFGSDYEQNAQAMKALLEQLEGQRTNGDGTVAYTTEDGQNVSWESLYDYRWAQENDTGAKRLQWYKDAQDKLAQLRQNGGSQAEIAALEARIQMYERGEYMDTGKAVDEYGRFSNAPDFLEMSADRSFMQADRDAAVNDTNLQRDISYVKELIDSPYDRDYYEQLYGSGADMFDSVKAAREHIENAYGIRLGDDATQNRQQLLGLLGTLQSGSGDNPEVKDKLGLYLSESEEEYGAFDPETIMSVMDEGAGGNWDYLTDDDVKTYYYLMNTKGEEAAYKFLDDMAVELGRRKYKAATGEIDKAGFVGRRLLGMATIPMNFLGNIAAPVGNVASAIRGDGYNPYATYNLPSLLGGYIRETNAEKLNEVVPWRLPLLEFSAGDVYQAIMSGADSALGAAVFGKAYTPLMGTSAATSEATRLYQAGASGGQIILGASAAGAAEMIFEKYSIDNLVDMKAPGTWVEAFKNVLIQGGIEASEEAATELANIIANHFVMQTESDWQEILDENGGDYGKAVQEEIRQIANAALDGFVSGSGSAVATQAGAVISNKAEESRIRDYAGAALTDLGETENVNEIAAAIGRQATGRTLSDRDIALISGSENAQNILQMLGAKPVVTSEEVNTTVQRLVNLGMGNAQAQVTAEKLLSAGKDYGKQSNIFVENYIPGQSVDEYRLGFDQLYTMGREGVNKSLMNQYGAGLQQSQKEIAYLAGQNDSEGNKAAKVNQEDDTLDVNAEGKTIRTDTNEDIEPTGFESVGENGMLSTKGGQSVSIRSVAFASYDDAVLYNTIAKVSSSPTIANTLLKQFRAQDSLSAIDFAAGLREAYEAGQIGDKTALELKDAEFAGKLTTGQREAVYNRGKRAAYQKAYQRQQDVKKKSGGKKEGKLHFDRKGREFDSVRESSLAVMDTLSKALGVDIYVYESYVNEKGQRVYLSDRGEKKAPNGYYDPSDGSIHIDLNAGQSGKGTMLFTVAHELTHFVKDWSSVKYRALADALVKQYQKRGVTVSELVDNQIAKAKQNGREISRQEAFDEVVADSMESMLSDENAAAFLERLSQRDKGLKEKIVSWLKELAAKLKKALSAYKDVKPDSPEGKMVAQMEDFRKEIMGIYTSALVDAGENFRGNGGTLSSDGDYLYSERVTDKDTLANGIVDQFVSEYKESHKGIQFSDRDPTAEATRAALEKENGKLREDVSRLRELLRLQGKVTGGTVMKPSSVEAAARWLNKYAGAKADVKELSRMLTEFYRFIATDKDYGWEDVHQRAMVIARFLQDNVQIKPQMSDYARNVLRDIRGIKITLDDSQRAKVEYKYGSYEAFRKAAFGNVTFVKDGGIPLDIQWQEWSSLYPGTFDSEITATDQPQALMDAIDTLRNSDTTVMEYAYNRESIAQDLAVAVYDSYWRVDALVTVADRDQRKINKLRSEHLAEMGKLKKERDKTVAALKQKRQEDMKKLRTDYRKKLEDTRTRYQESREKAVDSRNRTKMREQVKKTVNELNHLLLDGDKKRHVPESMRKAVAEILSAVNMETSTAEARSAAFERTIARYNQRIKLENDPAERARLEAARDAYIGKGDQFKAKIDALAKAYEDIKNSADPGLQDAYSDAVSQYLFTLEARVGDTRLGDMTLDQLKTVQEVLRIVMSTIRNANRSFLNERAGTIEQQAKRCIFEVSSVWRNKKEGESDVGRWLRGFHYRNLKPIYLMRAIGSNALTEAYNNLRRGEDTWYRDIQGGREFFLSQSGKHGYGKWDFEKTSTFTDDSGGKVKLTLGQIMSLYAYSKREAAAEHLRIGGVVIEGEAVRVNKLGMKVTYHLNDATSHQIGPETLAEIIGTLTKEQRAFADAMQDYLSTVMADKGNEVSLAMYGIKLFREKNYFPIKSAKQFVDQKNEPVGEVKLKNSGFTNKTVPKANNPMVLRDFMDVWADHVTEMSNYHAFVLAIEDFNRIINYQTARKEEIAPVSLKQTIQNYMGQEAVSAVRELIQSVNGGARVDPAATFVSKAINLFKKNAVFASASVVIQQPSSIVRAEALIDPKYFAGRTIDREKVNPTWDIIKKYAPVAGIKEMGYFDTNMGKSTVDYIKGPEHDGVKDVLTGIVKREKGSFDELFSMTPGYADKVTWCAIWEAVKRETAAKHPKLATRSEEFLRICGERFTEVITKTQVYDSVFARSGNMRSKDKLMGMATSFMAEPTTAINMIYDAVLQGTRGNKAYMKRAIGAVIGAAVLNAVLKSIVYAERDDDEDETFAEKYVSALVAALKDDVLFLVPNSIPFVRDIMSLVQGYSVERMDMELADDLISAVKKLYSDKASSEEKILGLAGSFGNLLFPAKNMIREVRALYSTIQNAFRNRGNTTVYGLSLALREGLTGKTESNGSQLYEARVRGDTAHEERVTARYENENAANSAVVQEIGRRFNDGSLSREEAVDHLGLYAGKNESEAYWMVREWAYAAEHGSTDGYSKYNDLYDAILSGGDITEPVREFTDHGTEEDSVMTNLKTQVGRWYYDSESEIRIDESQARDILSRYFGMKPGEIDEVVGKWNLKKETGISFDDLHEAMSDGKITREEAVEYLQRYGGLTGYDADERVEDWEFEDAHGYAYSDIKSTYLDEEITAEEALAVLVEIGGKSQDDAQKQIREWDYEAETGVNYSDKASQYRRGIITRQQLRQALMELGGYSGEDADLHIEAYDWQNDGYQGASFARVKSWHEYCEPAGVSRDMWLKIVLFSANTENDKREDGSSINYSAMKKVMAEIHKLPISRDQKTAIARALGWSERNIARFKPW